MKYLGIIIFITIAATACSSTKSVTRQQDAVTPPKRQSSVTFLDNVSLKPQSHRDKTGAADETGYQVAKTPVDRNAAYGNAYSKSGIENYSILQFKYAILLDASVEEMDNQKLLTFIDEWYGTRYRYGGSSKDGIDCSAFVASLMGSVYGIGNLPRISKDQYSNSKRIKRSELHEGDLVFFHTMGRKKSVTHVGMYLRNNKFIHASISGVMISSLDDGYYDQHYVGAGRVM